MPKLQMPKTPEYTEPNFGHDPPEGGKRIILPGGAIGYTPSKVKEGMVKQVYTECKTKSERARFITENMEAISDQVKKEGVNATSRHWKIPPSTLRYRVYKHLGWPISARYKPPNPPNPGLKLNDNPMKTSAPAPEDPGTPGVLPSLPPFDNAWAPGVQIAWLQAWIKAKENIC